MWSMISFSSALFILILCWFDQLYWLPITHFLYSVQATSTSSSSFDHHLDNRFYFYWNCRRRRYEHFNVSGLTILCLLDGDRDKDRGNARVGVHIFVQFPFKPVPSSLFLFFVFFFWNSFHRHHCDHHHLIILFFFLFHFTHRIVVLRYVEYFRLVSCFGYTAANSRCITAPLKVLNVDGM